MKPVERVVGGGEDVPLNVLPVAAIAAWQYYWVLHQLPHDCALKLTRYIVPFNLGRKKVERVSRVNFVDMENIQPLVSSSQQPICLPPRPEQQIEQHLSVICTR